MISILSVATVHATGIATMLRTQNGVPETSSPKPITQQGSRQWTVTRKHPLDKHLYAQRHLVECCFSKLKQFRRVATRYEKTARNYSAVVTIAAIVLWMR
jgi:transposase